MAGFYPDESPGGWNLIGRSAARFWDARRESPNLVSPGDEVVIVPVETIAWPDPEPIPAPPTGRAPAARVMRPATAMAIVAAADPRRLRWGLPASGPFDVAAAIAANHNVGNDDGAAVLECAISGPVLRFLSSATLSWCGGSGALSVSGEPVLDARAFIVGAGDELEIGRIVAGARGYLAVRGGFAPPPAAALPAMLRAGDSIEVAGEREGASHFRSLERETPREITVIEGPDSIDPAWRAILEGESWEVTPRSDRAGVRLTCARKPRGIPASLPSSGMLFGTIQWLPDGDLVAMGPDHPVTGGYLQPATIPSTERWKLAQLRPGDRVRWKLRV
jgi:allophanate hydrolase subunit 2